MNQEEFKKYYLNNLLEKLAMEKFFILVIFNIYYSMKNNPTNQFLDSLSSNMFLPYILLPTSISSNKKTVYLLGDFNINLLEYEKHNPTNEFLDSLSSNVFYLIFYSILELAAILKL